MAKINQIQKRLLELDGGAFQKLCDAYLHKKGYEAINSIGSVIGSNKVKKGTPDTLVTLPNGKYVFAEYTTQQKGLYGKMVGDLDKCFDESKTGIPVEKIEQVIFCNNSELAPADMESLMEKCSVEQVDLRVFGMGSLSYDLYLKYPGLARDFLNVQVDTGQILSQDEFVMAYNKGKFATPLDTTFRFRDEELRRITATLEERDLIIVSGRAGVGKSRLALQCCTRFTSTHVGYKVRCIINRGPDIFEDLKTHFSEKGNYLVFVDDANRVSGFDYVMQLLHHSPDDSKIKVLATVRDYAINKVRQVAEPYGGGAEFEIKPFDDKQIKDLLREEYGMKNPDYLNRIASIAKGNPRLAIMAARIACQEDRLDSISDVTRLYDEYYNSIRQDLKDLDSPGLLKVAGLVAFFRIVDRTDESLISSIRDAFGICGDAFWEAATQLHELEILDMYENEVVRISDQVLGTYIFYLAFFRMNALDFSNLLLNFFPKHRGRLCDAINPVLNAFDSKQIMDAMSPHVEKAWKRFDQENDRTGLLHLMSVFWFVKETDVLLRIKEWIEETEPKTVDPSTLVFKTDSSINPPSILDVLDSFRWSSDRAVKIALGLLLDYVIRHPDELPKVLHILIKTFGFESTDNLYGFAVQRCVVDVLWHRASEGKPLAAYVFLAVAERYLDTRFTSMRSTSKREVAITKFEIPSTPEIAAIRKRIWDGVFSLYRNDTFQERSLAVLRRYCRSTYEVSVKIVAQEASEVLQFIESDLAPDTYLHCTVVQDYLKFLSECKVPFDNALKDRFQNDTYRIAELLMEDYGSYSDKVDNYESFRKLKKERIGDAIGSYALADYRRLIEQCREIKERGQGIRRVHDLQEGLTMAFLALSERDDDLFVHVLRHYMDVNDPLEIQPFRLVKKLVMLQDPDTAYKLICKSDCAGQRWLSSFFECLGPDQVTEEWVQGLCAFYQKTEPSALPYGMDYLLNYLKVDEHIFARITGIILGRTEKEPHCVNALSFLFNPYSDANKKLEDLFADSLGVLKRAYIVVDMTETHTDDHDGSTFARILDLDPAFITEYIDARYERDERPSRYDDTCDYSFLWQRCDYLNVTTSIVMHVYACEQKRGILPSDYLEVFFRATDSNKSQEVITKRQDEVLIALIERFHDDVQFIRFLFALIAEFSTARQQLFLRCFLQNNRNYEVFERLRLQRSSCGWLGSAVPMLRGRIEFLESILTLLDGVDFLKHRQLVERRIQGLRSQIEREKKSDFIDD